MALACHTMFLKVLHEVGSQCQPSKLSGQLLMPRKFISRNIHSSFCSSATRNADSDWSAAQYLKFQDDRTRPVRDLLSYVPLQSPKRIVDLGCGPGNSTAVLAERFPNSHLTGMDSSPDMIQKARATLPQVEFSIEDLTSYTPNETVDLFFSNAVLQWLPYQERINIIARLMQTQNPGGFFAFQVPDNDLEPTHVAMAETAMSGPWSSTLRSLTPRDRFQTVQKIYDQLKPHCASINIWHTLYYHVLDDHDSIVEWVKGTGLRPFVAPLSAEERKGYLKAYLERLKAAYPVSVDGKVILRYPRLFVVAERK